MLATLFRRAYFTVIPLGVEHQFPDIDALSVEEYKSVLPEGLRRLPDLMIYKFDDQGPNVQFIEAKFRSSLSKEGIRSLKNTLTNQFETWPETTCILAIGEHPKYVGDDIKEYHHRYISIITPSELGSLPDEPLDFWRSLPSLTSQFPEFSSNWNANPLLDAIGRSGVEEMENLADDTVKIIMALASIERRG